MMNETNMNEEIKTMTTEDLQALATDKIRQFALADSSENGLDSTTYQVRKRWLSHLSNNTCYDLVYLIVFGVDQNFRRFGDTY